MGLRTSGLVLDVAREAWGASPGVVTLIDRSRFKNNGAMTAVTWSQLPSGLWVMGFNAISSRVLIPYSASVALNDNFTFLGWFKFPTGLPATRGALFNSHTPAYGAGGWSLEYGFGGDGNIDYVDEVAGWLGTGALVNDDTWRLISLTKAGVNLEIMFNAVSAMTSAGSGVLTPHTTNREIGRNAGNTYTAQSNALVRVYTRVLSATDIYKKFQAERRWFGV